MSEAKQIVLAARPQGMPKSSDFRVETVPMPQPKHGEALVRVIYLSIDPYMRGRISGVKSYAKGVDPGDVMVGGCVGQVVESHAPGLAATAVPVALFSRLAAIVRASRFESFETGFIFADNAGSTNMMRRLAMMIAGRAPQPYRRHAIYERTLGARTYCVRVRRRLPPAAPPRAGDCRRALRPAALERVRRRGG